MKVLILCALIAVSQAAVLLNHPALISTGSSTQYRAQDNIGNYNFGYDEGHLSGGTFRRESGDAFGNKVGSYGLSDADGRRRVVNYVANAAGFRANIQTNEPGVEPKDPAAVAINKAVVAAPVISYAEAAPVAPITPVVSYAAAAPAFHYAAAPFSYGHVASTVSYGHVASPLSYGYTHGLAVPNYGIYGYHL